MRENIWRGRAAPMTGHSVAVRLVRLGEWGEREVHKARREEGFVRRRKGEDVANFARTESFSIITKIEERKNRGSNGESGSEFISGS
jgi:hypothetical protein